MTQHQSETNQAVAVKEDTESGRTDFASVQLDYPLKRGKTVVESVTIRRPNAGALRGLSLIDVVMMNVTTLQKLLPRITEPALTEVEIAQHVDPADLAAMGAEVAGFLVKKKDKQAFQ
ncbi:phage tail assembly protein [Pusillimonas sp. NJUB218]|uniref:phage tail assembly protein n=1 Tax=Pusillimonas sp. NJUB218 TaxID=2023230 RepID=UPI000F4BA854|nr:phage tail assembly protein [Pusillimonas sp. NJUB218]ROT46086.1 hypothetical protein CHR62_03670 [Pusillimonas sp. NJUB218]